MHVRKMNAVRATPSKVDESGEEAAAGYDYNMRHRLKRHRAFKFNLPQLSTKQKPRMQQLWQ
jgi:hypothetical protein